MRTFMPIFKTLVVLFILGSLVGFAPAFSPGAAITVTTFVDEYGTEPSTGCSLREAITSANSATAFGGCASGTSGYDTIQLSTGTYTLSLAGTNEDNNATGDLDIKSSLLTIYGALPGPTVIDGGDVDRVFDIYIGTYLYYLTITNGLTSVSDAYLGKGGGVLVHSTSVTFSSNTITYNETGAGSSNAGGGIYSDGSNLTLNNVEISHNHVGDGNTIGCGAGIFNYDVAGGGGTLDINNSMILDNTCGSVMKTYYDIGGNGGGIYSSGSDADIFIDLTTISGNKAGDGTSQGAGNGGGLFSSGSGSIIQITQSVIDNNHAGNNTTNPGGSGGGIANYSGSYVSIFNSTISGNHAGDGTDNNDGRGGFGGGIDNNGIMDINYSTIAFNQTGSGSCDYSCMGGGIYDGPVGDTEAVHSILDGNTTNNLGAECYNTISVDYTLINEADDCTISGGTYFTYHSANLLPLAYNGGPTRTHALQPISLWVLDAYSCSGITDQRGVSRPIDGNHDGAIFCDIGSFEAGFQYGFIPLIKKPD